MIETTEKERTDVHIKEFFKALLTTGLDKESCKRNTAARFGVSWSEVEKII